MKYIISITTDCETLYRRDFAEATVLINRRRAIRAMQEMIAEQAKNPLLKDCVYTVCFETSDFEDLLIIESSKLNEENLDERRAIEYSIYKKNGWNAGGEPVEVYIPRLDKHAPILADNAKNNIGFMQLLNSI